MHGTFNAYEFTSLWIFIDSWQFSMFVVFSYGYIVEYHATNLTQYPVGSNTAITLNPLPSEYYECVYIRI